MSDRPLALTMPAVTVCMSPKGLPIARTQSPTSKFREVPSFTYGKGPPSILITATSVLASAATTRALCCFFVPRVTIISSAFAMTCRLVMIYPRGSHRKPEPTPCCR